MMLPFKVSSCPHPYFLVIVFTLHISLVTVNPESARILENMFTFVYSIFKNANLPNQSVKVDFRAL